jgi:hypothetical protein
MRFNLPTPEEIAAKAIWPKAVYPFMIIDAVDKLANSGLPMIEVDVQVSRRDGATRIIKDYLHVRRTEKLIGAAKACGVAEKVRAGSLEVDDLIGKKGTLRLGVEKRRGFPDRNIILEFIGNGV